MAILDLGSESRWRMLLLRAFGPNTDTSNYAGHWWDLNGVITSPPGDLGGLPGLAPVDGLWLIVGALRGLRIPGLSKKIYGAGKILVLKDATFQFKAVIKQKVYKMSFFKKNYTIYSKNTQSSIALMH